MPIFQINGEKLKKVKPKKVGGSNNEKKLQTLIEKNLEEIFEMSFVETEASTNHGGRIDTLAIDNDKRPVIIEYKADKSSTVLLQGLFYMDWIVENKAEFEKLVKARLKKDVEINWKGGVRLILIAKSFEIWDKFAVNRIKEDVELYEYILYENNEIKLEKAALPKDFRGSKKKTSITTIAGYTVEQHLKKIKDKQVKDLAVELMDKVSMISDDLQIKASKSSIIFRSNINIVYLWAGSKHFWFDVKLNKKEVRQKMKKLDVRDHKDTIFTHVRADHATSVNDLVSLVEWAFENTQ